MSSTISFVPKWKESEPKSIPQNQCGGCVHVHPHHAAAGSDSSRRFCSVTAVVRGSVIWLQREWGGRNGWVLRLSSQCRFWGKMAAVLLLSVPRVHMNWCEQEKHWKHGDAGCIYSDAVVHVRDECSTRACIRCSVVGVVLLEMRVCLFLELPGRFWKARMSRSACFDWSCDATTVPCRPKHKYIHL